jgi:hypothetical protein
MPRGSSVALARAAGGDRAQLRRRGPETVCRSRTYGSGPIRRPGRDLKRQCPSTTSRRSWTRLERELELLGQNCLDKIAWTRDKDIVAAENVRDKP